MKNIIYVAVAVAIIAALWLIFAGARPPAAPLTSNTAPASTSQAASGTTGASTSTLNSAYFSARTSPTLGHYLASSQGLTLYTFTHDTTGVSNCTGACLAKWPPYGPGLSATGTGVINLPMLPAGVSTIKGNNGLVQFTWQGMPLYTYFEDKSPGDAFGQGVLNAWYAVKLNS